MSVGDEVRDSMRVTDLQELHGVSVGDVVHLRRMPSPEVEVLRIYSNGDVLVHDHSFRNDAGIPGLGQFIVTIDTVSEVSL
jgi:hypothetical protein